MTMWWPSTRKGSLIICANLDKSSTIVIISCLYIFWVHHNLPDSNFITISHLLSVRITGLFDFSSPIAPRIISNSKLLFVICHFNCKRAFSCFRSWFKLRGQSWKPLRLTKSTNVPYICVESVRHESIIFEISSILTGLISRVYLLIFFQVRI